MYTRTQILPSGNKKKKCFCLFNEKGTINHRRIFPSSVNIRRKFFFLGGYDEIPYLDSVDTSASKLIDRLATYLHAPGLVNRKAGGAKFTSAYIASDSPWPFLGWRRGRSIQLRTTRFGFVSLLYDHLLGFVLALFATEMHAHWLLHGLWYRGLRLRIRWAVLYPRVIHLRVTVKSLRLIRRAATFTRFRGAPRGRGCEHLQIVLYRRPRNLLLQRGQ